MDRYTFTFPASAIPTIHKTASRETNARRIRVQLRVRKPRARTRLGERGRGWNVSGRSGRVPSRDAALRTRNGIKFARVMPANDLPASLHNRNLIPVLTASSIGRRSLLTIFFCGTLLLKSLRSSPLRVRPPESLPFKTARGFCPANKETQGTADFSLVWPCPPR